MNPSYQSQYYQQQPDNSNLGALATGALAIGGLSTIALMNDGKLLKDLDPISVGWDGTYIGRPMPQTDYWFRVFLEDGREFKVHFSLIRGK